MSAPRGLGRGRGLGLLTQGAPARLAVAAVIVAALWLCFLWATTPPGSG